MRKIMVINVGIRSIEVLGRYDLPQLDQPYQVCYEYNGTVKPLDLLPVSNNGANTAARYFRINEQLDENKRNVLKFCIKYEKRTVVQKLPDFGMFGRISNDTRLCYKKNGYMLYKSQRSLICEKKRFWKSAKWKFSYYRKKIAESNFEPLKYRAVYHIFNMFKIKPVWILSDRTMAANDNAMHLFKYLNSQKNLKANVYFAIDKNSQDYEKMKKYGKVLAYNSFMYKIKFLLSDKIISSQASPNVINAFGIEESNYRDILNFDFIFLSHGITQNDLSSILNKNHKNIKIFITAVYDEYMSILNGNYGYDESVVKLTGFPRYDNLKDESEKLIAVMPTWRKTLGGEIQIESGTRDYNPSFKESDYFKFYNSLINDKKLLDCMKKNGYKGLFVIHPSIEENWIDFEGNDVFKINNGFAEYQDIFKRANLLLSDYSSVLFDFAYLYKPVIYSQFDKEEFFTNHTVKPGYFDYERDGFGPVTYDYESTVDAIIKYIENGCKMEEKYSQRVDKFYKFHDHNNCERVYKEILALDKN